MASLTSWVDLKTFAIVVDPVRAAEIYAKLEDEPPVALDADEVLWLAALEVSLQEATWVLSTLMSGKLHPEECWIEDYRVHGKDVVLRRGPINIVARVEALSLCSTDEPRLMSSVTEWCWFGNSVVTLAMGANCGCRQQAIRVYYQTKDNLPPGAQGKVMWLAEQHYKASTGQKCDLPDRVTSITRQGVSWTMLDPMDFLAAGLTGVGRLDSWLSTARRENPSAKMVDPYKSDRIRSTKVDCAVDSGSFQMSSFGDFNPADPEPDPFATSSPGIWEEMEAP